MKLLYALLLSLLTFSSWAKEYNVQVFSKYTAEGYVFYATNKEEFPVVVEFTFDLNNLKVKPAMGSPYIIPPKRSNIKILTLVPVWRLSDFNYEFSHTVSELDEDALDANTLVAYDENSAFGTSQSDIFTDQNSRALHRERLNKEREMLKLEKKAALEEERRQRQQDRERLSNERAGMAQMKEVEKRQEERDAETYAAKAALERNKRLSEISENKNLAITEPVAETKAKTILEEENIRAEIQRMAKIEVEKALLAAGQKSESEGEKRLAEIARQAKTEEEKRLAEIERQARIEEEKRLAEVAEQARLEEEKRLAEVVRQAKLEMEKRLAEIERQAKIEEEKRIVAATEQAKKEQEIRLAEVAEQARIEEQRRLAKIEIQAKVEEEKRIAEIERKAKLEQEKRLAEIERQTKIEEEKRIAAVTEQAKKEREIRLAEIAEQTRIEEEKQMAEIEHQAKIVEEKRLAEIERQAKREEQRKSDETTPKAKQQSPYTPKNNTVIKTNAADRVSEPNVPNVTPTFEVTGKYDIAHKYNLPFEKGQTFYIAKGYQSSSSQQNPFALDFAVPEGTAVHAVRGGNVLFVEESHSQGCNTEKCKDIDNLIIVQHSDGSYAKYAHLKHEGATVNVGDTVSEGQLIGYSGKTGWTIDAALHLEIFIQKENNTPKTIKTNFKIGNGTDYGLLFENVSYTKGY